MGEWSPSLVGLIVVLCFSLWLFWFMYRAPVHRHPCPHRTSIYDTEAYDEPNEADTPQTRDQDQVQEEIDFSDVLVSPEQRQALEDITEDSKSIQTINQRFVQRTV